MIVDVWSTVTYEQTVGINNHASLNIFPTAGIVKTLMTVYTAIDLNLKHAMNIPHLLYNSTTTLNTDITVAEMAYYVMKTKWNPA